MLISDCFPKTHMLNFLKGLQRVSLKLTLWLSRGVCTERFIEDLLAEKENKNNKLTVEKSTIQLSTRYKLFFFRKSD